MATTIEDLKRWYESAKEEGATHLIVVCDTFDHEDFPVSVMPGEDVHKEVTKRQDAEHMSRVMEVYCLKKPFDKQKANGRFCWDLD